MLKKYKKLFQKFLGNIYRKSLEWQRNLIKALKFFYLLAMFPIEIVGDILFLGKRFKKGKIHNPKRILIVKIDQFGDVLFSTFMLPLIKEKYPEAQIDYLINPKTEFVIKNNPHISNIYYWEDPFLHFLLGREKSNKPPIWKILKRDFDLVKTIRKENYDAVINTRAYSPSTNIFWKLLRPKNLIAFDIAEQSFLADFWVDYDLYDEEWRNYLNLLLPLGINKSKAEFKPGFFNFNEKEFMEKLPGLNKKFIVISPVSFDKERNWPVERWKEVIDFLTERNYQVVLTGLKSQENYLLSISAAVASPNLFIISDISIPGLGSVFNNAEFFIGIDSFPAHLALALNKPIICFVNEQIYFLKNFSQKKFYMDARCMIPLVDKVKIVPTTNSTSEYVISLAEELIGGEM